MKRGEIWTVAGGVYSSKPRPGVIMQADQFGDLDSVTVCPLTTVLTDAPLARPSVEPDEGNGLRKPCQVMTDKITTVPRTKIGGRVGVLSADQMTQVSRSLVVFLGIAG